MCTQNTQNSLACKHFMITSMVTHRHCSGLKLEFHHADTDTDVLARVLADTYNARFPEVIPMAS